jgi:hypothetical protein
MDWSAILGMAVAGGCAATVGYVVWQTEAQLRANTRAMDRNDKASAELKEFLALGARSEEIAASAREVAASARRQAEWLSAWQPVEMPAVAEPLPASVRAFEDSLPSVSGKLTGVWNDQFDGNWSIETTTDASGNTEMPYTVTMPTNDTLPVGSFVRVKPDGMVAVAGPGDTPFGVVVWASSAGGAVEVHVAGQTTVPTVAVAPPEPDIPEIPLSSIREARMEITRDSINVGTYGDPDQYVQGRRRVTIDLTCDLALTTYPSYVMLHGRRMMVDSAAWQATDDGPIHCDMQLRPVSGEVTSAWWDEVVAGSTGPFGALAAAGLTTSQAMQQLGVTLGELSGAMGGAMSDDQRNRFARRYADRKTKTPAPEPTVRPSGRRFDFGDE